MQLKSIGESLTALNSINKVLTNTSLSLESNQVALTAIGKQYSTTTLKAAIAQSQLNKEQIKEIIPQREPFLMIDEVEEYIPGKSAIAYKNVNEEEWYFKGHFPGNPIMPGVLITESLAQTGAVAILSYEENKGKNALFGGIDKMKFKKIAALLMAACMAASLAGCGGGSDSSSSNAGTEDTADADTSGDTDTADAATEDAAGAEEEAPQVAPGKKGTIEFWTVFTGADGTSMQAMVDAYNATEPDYTVNHRAMEANDFNIGRILPEEFFARY